MAEYLTLAAVQERLRSSDSLTTDAFGLLKRLNTSLHAADFEPDSDALEVVIRLLERREELAESEAILSSLLRQSGLFPYIDARAVGVRDQLAFEAHRPLEVEDVVFHRIQADIYRRLLEGESVILSAPTSFGKSLLIDAVVASRAHRNIAIIVPTIALIDETRRRLARFADRYKIITHPSQRLSEYNILVFTQERLLDLAQLDDLDFFVIDEFYKLDVGQDVERSDLLNQALLRLLATDARYLMIGPSVDGLNEQALSGLDASFVKTDFKTVAANITRVQSQNDAARLDKVAPTIAELDGPTLVFCRSPARIAQVTALLEREPTQDPSILAAADWLGENFHPDWYVVDCLRRGIGVHHGRLPRSVAQWMVRAFNDGRLPLLFCTSTLIEGVNTRAKNIVIFDRTIARKAYDFFTFNNIRGRSGRMFRHFVGEVILFHDPPQEQLPIVDIPAVSQGSSSPDSLLIQIKDDDLSDASRTRLTPYLNQDFLSLETLRANSGVDPGRQVALAERVLGDLPLAQTLSWSGFPTFDQLASAGELILRDLKGSAGMVSGVASGRQLAYRMNRLLDSQGNAKPLIDQEVSDGSSGSDAVESVLDFMRYWPSHNLPRYLMALDRIQAEVLPRSGVAAGAYVSYAAAVEALFGSPSLALLEEYGIPVQVARKISSSLDPAGDLDSILAEISTLVPGDFPLSPFERELLTDAINHL